jgi:hypothetical protein
MVSVLNVNATPKSCCEDSVFFQEDENNVWGIIADGSSIGIKSHFASQVLAYFVEREGYPDITSDNTMERLFAFLRQVQFLFQFSTVNLMCTCVLFSYKKGSKTLSIRALGEGTYFINGIGSSILSDKETDYVSNHITDTKYQLYKYLNKYPEIIHTDVERFVIASDGIKYIEKPKEISEETISLDILLEAPSSTNYLTRIWSAFKRQGYLLLNDLSIISYAPDPYNND